MAKRSRNPSRAARWVAALLAYTGYSLLSSLQRASEKPEKVDLELVALPSPLQRRDRPGWWAIWAIMKDAASGWVSHKAGQLGASLAYYSIFSLGPLLVVALAVAGLVFDQSAARAALTQQLEAMLGHQAASGIEGMLAGAGKPAEGVFATLLGIAALAFGSVGVVVQLKEALNAVFGSQGPPPSGIWGFVRTYAVSFAGVISMGFLLLVSLILSTVLSAAGSFLQSYVPEIVMQAVTFVGSFAMTSALFAAMFRWLPDEDIAWRHIIPGAVLTAVLFEIGRFLISFYIGKQGLESTFGAAASLVVVLVWVYYSAQIVIFGAEVVRATSPELRRTPPGRGENIL